MVDYVRKIKPNLKAINERVCTHMENENKNTNENEETKDNVQDNTNENKETKDSEKEQESQEDKGENEEKKFTQEELDKILNKKFAKWKAQQEADKKEAERIANMTAEEKIQEERKKLEKEKREFELAKLTTETAKDLMTKNLPSEFADFLVAADKETTNQRVDLFAKAFDAAVAAAVNERFKNKPPKASVGTSKSGITKEQFRKMNIIQQAQLQQSNPELYDELVKM